MDLKSFESLVKKQDALLFYFTGEACTVCASLKPKLSELMISKFPKVEVHYLEISKSSMLCAQLRMLSVPGILFIMDGKEVFRSNGLISMKVLEAKIERPYSLFFENGKNK
ncbi:thioredoxin family protein [Litoribacter ruber]|uniref:Thioredoxin family protein n=2 Tax=Litoribacter ruber TaxID=702568 RepID=A0AAP2CGX9_9BACT|nr:thioredoxin family protein [Litoribacter alkaliphilus]MBS9523001.1 thioredoxin family protein [Litoribacter alkaliphilus]MBT0810835.1 thioredoxin family protein [Litoribacter ruber]